jgi:hypothetical protein
MSSDSFPLSLFHKKKFFLHRFRELDALKKPKISESGGGTSRDPSASPSSAAAGGQTTESNGFKIPDVPKPTTAAGGEAIEDWTGEVRARHCHKNCISFSRILYIVFSQNEIIKLAKICCNFTSVSDPDSFDSFDTDSDPAF